MLSACLSAKEARTATVKNKLLNSLSQDDIESLTKVMSAIAFATEQGQFEVEVGEIGYAVADALEDLGYSAISFYAGWYISWRK